jgi:Holliday junction DNA helicase RuvA
VIGSLRGRLLPSPAVGEVLVEVGGVGYRVSVTPGTQAALAGAGPVGNGHSPPEVHLHTHLLVREDALTLFGFATRAERDCFEALLGAHGVGPALALAILSVHAPAELGRVVAAGDRDALTLVPGVGPKTAARLMIELKSRLHPAGYDDRAAEGGSSARSELRAALVTLGYSDDEMHGALRELPPEGEVGELLRAALRLLGARR